METMANPSNARHRWPVAAMMALALACTATAQAGVYKCEGTGGVPVYQDTPCPPGKVLRDFDKDPPALTVMPSIPSVSPSIPSASPGAAAPRTPAGSTAASSAAPSSAATIGATTKGGAKIKPLAAANGKAGERKFLAPGISEGEVMTRLGPPDMKNGSNGRKTSRWTYLPAPDDPDTVTTLTFDSGRLVEVERKVVK
jgi:hypothetical protein